MAKGSSKKKNGLKIDFAGVEARTLVAEGDYLVKPIEVTQEEGNEYPYLAWVYEIQEGEFKGKKLYDNTSLSPNALFRLRGMLEAAGIEVPDGVMELDPDQVIEDAEAFGVTVEHEKYDGKTRARVVDTFKWSGGEDEEEKKSESKKDKGSKKGAEAKDEAEEESDETPDFDEMDKDELEKFVDEHDLDIDLDDFPKLSKARAAVQKAWEARDESGGDSKDDAKGSSYSEDAINEMGTKELQSVVDKEELDIELEGTTKAKRRAVLKALKKAGKLDD